MFKYIKQESIIDSKCNLDIVQTNNKEPRLLLLPIELQMKIFVLSQNPLLVKTCRSMWRLGSSIGLRVEYLLHRYGSSNVLGQRALKRKIATPKVVEHLLRYKQCDPKAHDDYWLFKRACELNQVELAEWIIEASLVQGRQKKSVLDHLCTIAAMIGSIPVIDILVMKFQADIHQEGEEIPLIMACEENRLDMVIHLHQTYQCNIHHQNERFLRAACLRGFTQLASFLMQSGANVHAQNDAAIHNAVFKGHASITKQLLEFGANAEANHNSCIRLAISNGNFDIVQYLVSLGGVNPRFHHDWPLKQACRHGHDAIVKYLLDVIQIPDVVDLQDGVLMEYALTQRRLSLVGILINDYKARLDTTGSMRGIQYLLKSPSRTQNMKILKLLTDSGVDLTNYM